MNVFDNNVTIVAPLPSISKRVRLFKITKFLYHIGVKNFNHIAWERITGESEEKDLDFKISKKIILKGGGYGGRKVRLMYLLWMIKVFFKGFSIQKNEIVWALGFESAFPLLLSSKIKGFNIYFDDADRFSMIYNLPIPFSTILIFFEKVTSRNVYRHIIPVKERYNFESPNFFLLSNTPSMIELNLANNIYEQEKWIKGRVVININGWLGHGRGMSTAFKLHNELKNEKVAFILAGKLDCNEAENLAKQENVQYLGKVTNAKALASYLASDFVFTYYDPKMPINKYAASNKWGDAIFTKTGIIVNKEVETAKHLMSNGVAISFTYDDYKGLAGCIKEMCNDSSHMNEMKNKINTLSEIMPNFEDQLKMLFSYEAK